MKSFMRQKKYRDTDDEDKQNFTTVITLQTALINRRFSH